LWIAFAELLRLIDGDKEIPQERLDNFATLWLDNFRYPNLPIYLHILNEHYNEKLRAFGGLKVFSQEGVESHHLYQKQIQTRQTSGGGGVGKKKLMFTKEL
jgi:hypothetical protein